MGGCREIGKGCFICVDTGHFSRDCPQESVSICFHCNQVAHKKADYLELISGALREPAPATLRNIDGHKDMVEVSVGRSRVL